MAYQMCPLYNLKAGVGRNCPNHRSDVALVEGLLSVVYEARSLEFWRTFYSTGKTPFPKKALQMRATYDENLQAWIDLFLSIESAATPDGRFDPLRFKNGMAVTSAGGKRANFYLLMYRAFGTDTRKFMELGYTFDLPIAIEGPEFIVTRSLCGL